MNLTPTQIDAEPLNMVPLPGRKVRDARAFILKQRCARAVAGGRPDEEPRDDEYWCAVRFLDERA
jgi:hypothetical protein